MEETSALNFEGDPCVPVTASPMTTLATTQRSVSPTHCPPIPNSLSTHRLPPMQGEKKTNTVIELPQPQFGRVNTSISVNNRKVGFSGIAMITPQQVEAMIKAEMPDAQVQVQDLTGGGDHYQVTVVSSQFAGKGLVQQHQLVYGALRQAMSTEAIHALALKTYTPEAWQTTAS